MILLDTNVLTRLTCTATLPAEDARLIVQSLWKRREQLVIVPQNLYEFWAVATRSASPPPQGQNGLGMTVEQAGHWLRFLQRRFILLPDRDDLSQIWQRLVQTHAVTGYRSHDVRLVAAMQSYGITRLLTFNARDFQTLPVTIVEPGAV